MSSDLTRANESQKGSGNLGSSGGESPLRSEGGGPAPVFVTVT